MHIRTPRCCTHGVQKGVTVQAFWGGEEVATTRPVPPNTSTHPCHRGEHTAHCIDRRRAKDHQGWFHDTRAGTQRRPGQALGGAGHRRTMQYCPRFTASVAVVLWCVPRLRQRRVWTKGAGGTNYTLVPPCTVPPERATDSPTRGHQMKEGAGGGGGCGRTRPFHYNSTVNRGKMFFGTVDF